MVFTRSQIENHSTEGLREELVKFSDIADQLKELTVSSTVFQKSTKN